MKKEASKTGYTRPEMRMVLTIVSQMLCSSNTPEDDNYGINQMIRDSENNF